MKDSLAQTVLVYVHLTASMASVDTRTDRVLPVLKDGWVVIVQQVILHTVYFRIDEKNVKSKYCIKNITKNISKHTNKQTTKLKKVKKKKEKERKPTARIVYHP